MKLIKKWKRKQELLEEDPYLDNWRMIAVFSFSLAVAIFLLGIFAVSPKWDANTKAIIHICYLIIAGIAEDFSVWYYLRYRERLRMLMRSWPWNT